MDVYSADAESIAHANAASLLESREWRYIKVISIVWMLRVQCRCYEYSVDVDSTVWMLTVWCSFHWLEPLQWTDKGARHSACI